MNKQELIKKIECCELGGLKDCCNEAQTDLYNWIIETVKQLDEPPMEPCEYCEEAKDTPMWWEAKDTPMWWEEEEVDKPLRDVLPVYSKYCPNCGRRMEEESDGHKG